MKFIITYVLLTLAGVTVTANALAGHLSGGILGAVFAILLLIWLSPILIWNLQTARKIPLSLYTIIAKVGYFALGYAFLLLMFLIVRDVLWELLHFLSGGRIIGPTNFICLNYANIITLIVLLFLCLYGIYAAERKPRILRFAYQDKRISKKQKILLFSDLHITKMTPLGKIRSWVQMFNALRPDIVLVPGDVADDNADDIREKIRELKKLKANSGIFYTIGNHEAYFNAPVWEAEFAALGWIVLHNSGVSVADSGIYIGGIPDYETFAVSVKQALRGAADSEYRILLSHSPAVLKVIDNSGFDLLVAGHTHGGQIFPFNYFTRLGNAGFVAGEYSLGKSKMVITSGAGYWGPPIRLGASSDVVIIELLPGDGAS